MSPEGHQPPPAATATPGHEDGGLRIWSCATCRRRKVKCDRRDPCANCVRNNIECHFPVTGRLPRRSRDPAATKATPSQRQVELLGRLRRLEDLVTELSGQLEDGTGGQLLGLPLLGLSTSSGPASATTSASASASMDKTPLTAGTEMYENFGRLVVDQGLGPRLDRGFWSVFCDEVNHIFEAIEGGPEEPEPTRDNKHMDDGLSTTAHCYGYVFGTPCAPAAQEDPPYPLPSQVPFLWRTYVDNVDPFIKILHVPSVEAIITQAKGKLDHQSPAFQALLFAVCLAAIVSLDADDVSDSFRVSKSELVSCLRLKTERALGHAQFATTKDVVVVQALTIYLFILPHIGDGELAGNLVGVLVRIATRMGLHKDPLGQSSHGPDPTVLDVEARRRLWWHILFLDSRGQSLNTPGGGTVSQDSFTIRMPANADDRRLAETPAATSNTPDGGHRLLTPTTLSIIRCDIWRLRNSLRQTCEQPLDLQLQQMYATKAHIERTYLSDQAPTDAAFASFLTAMTGLFFAKIEAEICRHHIRRTRDDHPESPTHARFFAASVAVIQATRDLCSPQQPAWDRWRWHLRGSFPWRAVGSVFIHLCQLPWTPVSEQAWELAHGLLEGLPDSSRREAAWRRLNELASDAGVHRRRQLEKQASDETSSGWSSVQREEAGRETVSRAIDAVTRQEPHQGHEMQTSLIAGVLAETAAAEWERDVYALDEVLGGWLDWDGVANVDMF